MIRILTSSTAVLALCLGLAGPAAAQSVAGPYLAGRQAAAQHNYDAAASYFVRALAHDPGNVELMDAATVAYLSLGDMARALPIAQALEDADQHSQVAQMVLTANNIVEENFAGLTKRDPDAPGIGPLVDGLIEAWAFMGTGEVSEALAQFDTISTEVGLQGFALYHKALALALVGDFEGAEAIFAGDGAGGMVVTRRGAMARAEVLSQLERNEDALALLGEAFAGATDPELDRLIASLETGERVPFSYVTSVREGFAEVFYSLAAALQSEAGPDYTLLYSQVAVFLRPDHIDARLMTAELLEALGQYDLAIAAYKQVPPENPAYHAAELGRAAALRDAGKPEAAIEVLEQLTRSHGDMPVVQSALADALRQQERFAEAVVAYDRALELTAEGARTRWFLFYARGIAYERLSEWAASEADFRAALALNPGQPQVLNYLGYSLVERQEKLDEALAMIKQAAEANPDSGYIIDSLGWVLYRLGRYTEAVGHMERAVELMPVDPVVNDHLGDVLWAVGRIREAEFQWARALSFVDETDADSEADPDRIRAKLKSGLDKVLADEGSAPLKVAKDE